VAVLTVVGGSVVSVRMTTAVESAGADIDLAKTLDVVSERSATPDADATYTTFDGEPLRLSIYRPRATVTPAAVLVFVHGGGFVAGDRDAHGTDYRWFAEGGWLVVSVDYALASPDRHLWDVVQPQLGCALTWVTANAHRYGGDPARLSLSGDSAGGNLAINTAYTGGSPVEFPQRHAAITSATHLGATAPPTLILFGGRRPPGADRWDVPLRGPCPGGRGGRRAGRRAVRRPRVRCPTWQRRTAGLPAADRKVVARSRSGAVTGGLLSGNT
jgi:poly(3-hydroxybutyrate) depolymerase